MSKSILTKQECYDLKKDSMYLVNNVVGFWKWVGEYRYNQITGEKIVTTPESAGYNKYVTFDNANKCYFYKNTTLVGNYSYKIARLFEITQYYLDSNLVLGFYNPTFNAYDGFDYLKPCNDTLILDQTALNDAGSIITYIRN
jgi:hypothetical protein